MSLRKFTYAQAFARQEMVIHDTYTRTVIEAPPDFGSLLDTCLNYIYEQVPSERLFWIEPKLDIIVHQRRVQQFYAKFLCSYDHIAEVFFVREIYEDNVIQGVYTQQGCKPLQEVLCEEQALAAYRTFVTVS